MHLGPQRVPEAPIPLFRTTKLKGVAFQSSANNIEWATAGLKTITLEHKDLRQVLLVISFLPSINERSKEEVYAQWMDLDRILIRLRKSPLVHAKLCYIVGADPEAGERTRELIGNLLPESTKAGAVELADNAG